MFSCQRILQLGFSRYYIRLLSRIKSKNDQLIISNILLSYIALINGLWFINAWIISNGYLKKTAIAMPETLIDLFPNGSDSHFLSRLPNNLGVFLSLTGHRLYGIHAIIDKDNKPQWQPNELENISNE
ncbi:unnamed protein product [Rotaria sordida]|uniref:3-hydroxyisobutyryl-CoA hydrolase n=1 Tax=Rotaria sordida TaxID=392033 RepID=A0A815LXW2_9BILA|nr:unnamed protein product [Rotaria sordida]